MPSSNDNALRSQTEPLEGTWKLLVVVDERWRSADLVGPDEMRLFLGHDSPGTS